jgi:hypothetical protein
MTKQWRKMRVCLVALLAAYLAVYLVLTANGSYCVAAVGLHGPISCVWTPLGFRTHEARQPGRSSEQYGRRNYFMIKLFLPLYYIDTRVFHKTGGAEKLGQQGANE